MTGDIVTTNGTLIQALPRRLDTLLVRNHDMVHWRGCFRIRTSYVTPWSWAEGRTPEDIGTARENGLKFCSSCNPLGVVASLTDKH